MLSYQDSKYHSLNTNKGNPVGLELGQIPLQRAWPGFSVCIYIYIYTDIDIDNIDII